MSGILSTIIAPVPLPLSVQKAHYATTVPEGTASLHVLASLVGGISIQPGSSTSIDNNQYACALSIAHACYVIEECHKDASPQRVSSSTFSNF